MDHRCIPTLGLCLLALSSAAVAQPSALGGVTTDMALDSTVCRNNVTGQKVKVRQSGSNRQAYDCTAAGLAAQDGDSISITLTGVALSARPPLQAGLLARYALDGNGQDGSGERRHGQVEQAEPATDRFNRTATAMSFNGSGAHIRLPAMPSPTSNTYSVSAWIHPTACEMWLDGAILSSATWSPGKVLLSLRTVDGVCRLHAAEYDIKPDRQTGPGKTEFYASFPILLNQWQHVVWTMDAARKEARFYLNGEGDTPIGFKNLNGLTAPDFSDLAIGAFLDDGRFYRGRIDDLWIHGGVALSPPQVKALYNAGS